jgi:hypothetical protein
MFSRFKMSGALIALVMMGMTAAQSAHAAIIRVTVTNNSDAKEVNDFHAIFRGTGNGITKPVMIDDPTKGAKIEVGDPKQGKGNQIDITFKGNLAKKQAFTFQFDVPSEKVFLDESSYWTKDGKKVDGVKKDRDKVGMSACTLKPIPDAEVKLDSMNRDPVLGAIFKSATLDSELATVSCEIISEPDPTPSPTPLPTPSPTPSPVPSPSPSPIPTLSPDSNPSPSRF